MNDTKKKILETAFSLLVEKGYHGVSIGDITNKLNIARSLPYKYFKSKNDIFYETFKYYFYDRFFYGVDDFSTLSLDALIDLISERMVEIFKNLKSANISVFDYNSLYILALKNEPRFRDYMTAQMKRSGIIIDNAMKNGEIKNGISSDFIKRVLLDIWGRTSSLGTTDDVAKLNDLLDDIRTFKQLIKGEI